MGGECRAPASEQRTARHRFPLHSPHVRRCRNPQQRVAGAAPHLAAAIFSPWNGEKGAVIRDFADHQRCKKSVGVAASLFLPVYGRAIAYGGASPHSGRFAATSPPCPWERKPKPFKAATLEVSISSPPRMWG
ncbi:hypothetical protein EOA16_29875 [Mesorhizobium sp. M7A.F.Ca.US.008.03.1.1]|nr:hypothetical protein EOA16_29875 [Mesorhizobium sp. M7A.F.Ca.US.008.03.1.1]